MKNSIVIYKGIIDKSINVYCSTKHGNRQYSTHICLEKQYELFTRRWEYHFRLYTPKRGPGIAITVEPIIKMIKTVVYEN